MPSFLSGRQSSRSQHQQQQQQQQQQSPSTPLRQQQLFADPPSGPGTGSIPAQDPGSVSALSFSNTDLPSFDLLQTNQGPDELQFSSQQLQDAQQDQQYQQHHRPPRQVSFGNASEGSVLDKSSSSKSPSVVPSSVFDGQQSVLTKQLNTDYLEQVSRSQSQRYPAQQSPLQIHQHYSSSSLGAVSVDNLGGLPQISPQYKQQQQQKLSAPLPPLTQEKTRSTRSRLFKNFLGGGSGSNRGSSSDSNGRSQQQQQPSTLQNILDSAGSLAQRSSKRLSQQQASSSRTPASQSPVIDPPASEWPLFSQSQQQQQQYIGVEASDNLSSTQPSPHPGIGEFVRGSQGGLYSVTDGDQAQPSPIRVLTGDLGQQESLPYGPDDIGRARTTQSYSRQLQTSSPKEHLNLQQPQQATSGEHSAFQPQPGHLNSSQQQLQQPQQQQQQQYPALQYHQQTHTISANNPHARFIGQLSTSSLQLQHPSSTLPQQSPNPETGSQLSYESTVIDADQLASIQTASSSTDAFSLQEPQVQPQYRQQGTRQDATPTPPPLASPHNTQQPPAPNQIGQKPQQSTPLQNPATNDDLQDWKQLQNMAPQAGGPPPNRRSQDTGDRGGQPPPYRHGHPATASSGSGNMSPLPPLPPLISNQGGNPGGSTPNSYRTADQRQYEAGTSDEHHISPSPHPAPSDRDSAAVVAAAADSEKTLKELASKYKNVKRLYFEGKGQIDLLTNQIEQLQDAIANQRMSQSRTALDDNEYVTRFNRLNGAINNMAFNIRKDWVSLPSWIEPYTSPDAVKTGKQEIIAVGRAIITRWVMQSIFDRCFHPGLDPALSASLKEIEQNIRRYSYKRSSQEEFDALTNKIVSWRMSTLEGLQGTLSSPKCNDNRTKLTQLATADLTTFLHQHLSNPPPPGVDGGAMMIVELAVGIAANLPMESRDVAVSYPMPLDLIAPHLMDVDVEKGGLPPLNTRPADDGGEHDDGDDDNDGASNDDASVGRSRSAHPSNDMPRVRFSGFVAVEVRGRQVLRKAPVWAL